MFASLLLLRLPQPTLARPAPLPTGSGWSYELKWDGFRAIVSTEEGLRVRSRRGFGFNMTPTAPELRKMPAGLVLDGELVAWKGREPWFPNICRRALNHDLAVPVTFVAFERGWVKVKNPNYWRRESEIEGVRRSANRRRRRALNSA